MAYITLTDRSVIVTGAGSGVGRAIARAVAAQGAYVVVGDINAETAQETVDMIAQEGGQASAVVGDISASENAAQLVAEAVAHGPLRGVVSNAGVMDNNAGVGEYDEKRFDLIFAINVRGPFQLLKAAMPELKKNGGSIVNIASAAAIRGAAAGVIYTASKHAIVGLTKNTAYRYAKEGVRCNAILPGGVNTNIGKEMAKLNLDPQSMEVFAGLQQASVRIAEPEEIAHTAVYLLADETRNINGALINHDAGWCAG
ncbi:SDR family NAD(P)-dependent oxidoreductase [Actinobaculum suis]|uniref:SDR family NAD(P)-dependent oxidoreductase n=1 Tax=Actinobaculum suis TaxID=1657 RepID=UPI00066FC030|nr:SDR family oxidoreductase [Actinobaculum suis]